jgi:hypothetical protein
MKNNQLLADQWNSIGEDDIIVSHSNQTKQKDIPQNLQLACDIDEVTQKVNVVFKI